MKRKELSRKEMSNDSSRVGNASIQTYNTPPTKSTRSPLRWFGGKGVLAKRIIKFFPPHSTYLEVFGGGASVLFNKKQAPNEILNDINLPLYNFYTALKDAKSFPSLYEQILATPYHRAIFQEARESDLMDPLTFYILNRQGFGGNNDSYSWSFAVNQSAISMSAATSKWLTTSQYLHWHHKRLQSVSITNLDFRESISPHLSSPTTLIYLDPPYLKSTRKDGGYHDEMSFNDHIELLEAIKSSTSMIVLSGYPNPYYTSILNDWRQIDFSMPCFAVGRVRGSGTLGKGGLEKHNRTEALWINPPLIRALKGR